MKLYTSCEALWKIIEKQSKYSEETLSLNLSRNVSYRALCSYQQTIPSRYVKEVFGAADKNGDGFLEKSEFTAFLDNIGAGEQLTSEELDEILAEVVEEDSGTADRISVERAKEVMLDNILKDK